MVLAAFTGPCPEGMETCHNDGNRQNNFVENLRWDTHANNNRDRAKHGTTNAGKKFNIGEDHPLARMTDDKVRQLRSMYETGEYKQKHLAKMFGIGSAMAGRIIARKNWAHVL